MSATGAANKSVFSLSTQEGIPSGPDALFVLSADSFLMTENSDIGRGGSCWCTYACACISGVASRVNALIGDKKAPLITLAKCLGSSPSSARCWRSAMGLARSTLEKPLKVIAHLQRCLACKRCSASGLNCRYLNPV